MKTKCTNLYNNPLVIYMRRAGQGIRFLSHGSRRLSPLPLHVVYYLSVGLTDMETN